MTSSLDPRTPVVVGVGEASERLDDPGYARRSAVELAAAAAREALADSGADPSALARALHTVAAVRQFEVSLPGEWAVLGRSDNVPRSVARRIGADPVRAVLEVVGGQSPQHLVTELAGEIAAGRCGGALVVGAEAISTTRHLVGAPDRPDFTERVGGQLEDRGFGLDGLTSSPGLAPGMLGIPGAYALCENARRTRLGLSRREYDDEMGELFAPFTQVAARHPHAAAPTVRTARELVEPTARNRPVADPYPRFLVARDQVNQGAAAIVLPLEQARRLGVPEERWVFLHGHADLRERSLLERADLGAAPASVLAVRHALEVAGAGLDDVAVLDLYSCFPVAVLTVLDGLGLHTDDPRGLTVTGGLPFFGGPGNDYALHAVAEVVRRVRAAPGSLGLVGANGGVLSKYSAGVYGTTPAPWRPDRSAALQAEVDAWPAPPTAAAGTAHPPEGPATVETWTVLHGGGTRTGVVLARLAGAPGSDGDGARTLAVVADDALLALLSDGEPSGAPVVLSSAGGQVTARSA